MRIAGAQIPVSKDVEQNVKTIKHAIDWATDNECDFLVTPEGSLSGYFPEFNVDATKEALHEIEEYAKNSTLGLCLGTLWAEDEARGSIRRNQIRFYNREGVFIGATNKTHLVLPDETFLGHDLNECIPVHTLIGDSKTGREHLKAVGLICNDMWPHGTKSIVHMATSRDADVLIHSSNGARGNVRDKLYNDWHNAHLRMASHQCCPIITVDNTLHMNGEFYDGPTSSESGVVIDGEYVTKVPRIGTQYFYWDF